VRAFPDRSAEKGGIAFVEDIDDAIVVYGLTAFAEFSAASRTGSDFLGDGLAARPTEFHNSILRGTE
jgi:hypothetical protein